MERRCVVRIILEMPRVPFLLSDGREVLKKQDWRKYITFEKGRLRGCGIACRETFAVLQGVKLYRDGEWQAGDGSRAQFPGVPAIKPEVFAIIGAASPLPCL